MAAILNLCMIHVHVGPNDVVWRHRVTIASFDTENMWFGEIISFLSQLLTTTC